MGRYNDTGGTGIPYSDLHPERCQPLPGPAFVLPGEKKARELGVDPDMPPAGDMPHWRRPVTVGNAHLKGRP
jgi:hypothetical protein